MKYLAPAALLLSAAPAFAHDGMHLHPHADHPAWLPMILGSLVLGAAAWMIWGRK